MSREGLVSDVRSPAPQMKKRLEKDKESEGEGGEGPRAVLLQLNQSCIAEALLAGGEAGARACMCLGGSTVAPLQQQLQDR